MVLVSVQLLSNRFKLLKTKRNTCKHFHYVFASNIHRGKSILNARTVHIKRNNILNLKTTSNVFLFRYEISSGGKMNYLFRFNIILYDNK